MPPAESVGTDAAQPRRRPDRFTVVLLGTVIGILVLAEGLTVGWFDKISRVHRRQQSQREALLAVRDTAGQAGEHAAVLGNSLLLDAVNVPQLAERMDRRIEPRPYFVLATLYYDWLFGLKRLFAEGMRPRYVVLGLSPNQFASPYTRGDYAAQYLFLREDLIEIARKTDMDATTASGFILSHFSHFYGTRGTTRGFLLNWVLPSVAELLSQLGSTRDPVIPEATLRPLAADRLAALDQLCRANGSQFILVIPPSYQKGTETIAQVGRSQGVTVLVPVANDELDGSYYQRDGFHLNEKGAAVFTTRLAEQLKQRVEARRGAL